MKENLKNIILWGFVTILVFLAGGNVFAYGNSGNGICECNSCIDCTNALNDNNNCSSTVKLNQSITNQAGSCIYNPVNWTNKIFDCQGNTIQGTGNGYGMYLQSNTENLQKNTETITCLNKYNITPDTVAFYHSNQCQHCQNMMPLVQNLTSKGYNFLWIEISTGENNNIKQDCLSGLLTSHYIPQFGCPSNGELHVGEFSSILEMENFAKKCKEDALYPSRDNNTVKNCTIKNFYYGIYIRETINNTITNNLVEQNLDTGIFLYSSPNNTLISNTASYNGYDGIWLLQSANNHITNNVANHNGLDGIILSYSSNNNNISNNTAISNGNGIYAFGGSDFNEISNNEISNNTNTGIGVSNCASWNLSVCPSGNSNNRHVAK